jgi:hypothetical protein
LLSSVARASAAWPAVVPASASAPAVAATRTADPAARPTSLLLPVAAAASKPFRPSRISPRPRGLFCYIRLRRLADGGWEPRKVTRVVRGPAPTSMQDSRRQKRCLFLLHFCTGHWPICTFARPLLVHQASGPLVCPCPHVTVPSCPLRDSVALTSPLL